MPQVIIYAAESVIRTDVDDKTVWMNGRSAQMSQKHLDGMLGELRLC